MKILLLGPECSRIEHFLSSQKIPFLRTEQAISTELLEKEKFDFGISYRYKKIIKEAEIDWFRGKLINLHISYLPYNRGSDPNFWSFFEDTPKGVTIHLIDKGIDTGKILLQKQLSFDIDTETLRSSYTKLSDEIEELFIKNFHEIIAQRIIARQQIGAGSFHLSSDKNKFLHLLQEQSWDTSVADIYKFGKHYRESQYV